MSQEKKVPNLTTPVLVGLLVIASFLLGSLWTRIKQTEPSLPKEEIKGTQTTPVPQAPEEAEVLSGEDWARIQKGGAGSKGEEGAVVTIVEFSEYQCPFCKRYVDEAYQQIWKDYADKIRYVFRDYPLPFHAHSQKMAEAARCAGDQNKYWEMHDLIFKKQEEWSGKESVDSLLPTYATQLGLIKADFTDCLSSGKYAQAIKDDMTLGQSVGVSGTPTFFINGQKLVGAQPFESFKQLIDEALKK